MKYERQSFEFQITLTDEEVKELAEWELAGEPYPYPEAYRKIWEAVQEGQHKLNLEAIKKAFCEN